MICIMDAKDSLDLVKSVYGINFVLSIEKNIRIDVDQ